MVKKGVKRSSVPGNLGPRVKKLDRKQSKLKAKHEQSLKTKLPSVLSITRSSLLVIKNNFRALGGILLIYLVLNTIFASGLGSLSTDFENIKSNLSNTSGNYHPLASGVIGFLQITLSSGAASSTAGSALQAILIVIISLVMIWALRQIASSKKFSLKEAFYNSSYPLIPFVLVLLFIFIQLLPLSIGSGVIASLVDSFQSVSGFWNLVIGLTFLLLFAWSAYMLCSSIFALYIVTLPGMHPRKALRSAKNLVKFRRLLIIRKVLFLPLIIILFMGIVIIPLIMWATALVVPVFYIISVVSLLFVHTYFYNLYRSLLE